MNDSSILKSPHKNFEDVKKIDENRIEYWEARELMPLLGYSKWDNFNKIVIKKAKSACKNSDQAVKNHFADIGKMIKIATGTATHMVVGGKVRKSIKDIGGTMPEDLPVEPHIKQLERTQTKQLKDANKILK